MRDIDVRLALHDKVLHEHRKDSDTRVLDELGVRHGVSRVDVAVVNGYLHGYEIKSDSDTLQRLPNQVAIYNEVFDHVTLVVGAKHAEKAASIIPDWWGIRVATEGKRGGISFKVSRKPKKNPGINPIALAELLWRDEVVQELQILGESGPILRKPRATLYQYLAEVMELDELRTVVRQRLKARENWRGQRSLSSNVG